MADEFDDFEAEFRAKQAPDAPAHPYRDDFSDVEAEFRASQAAPESRPSSGLDDALALGRRAIEVATPGGRYLRRAAEEGPEAAVRLAAQDATIPSRYGEKAGRAMGERFARETSEKFGMEPSTEAEKTIADVGGWLGHLGGKGLEILGLSAVMPGVAPAGAGLQTLGRQAAGRAVHGALTFGSEQAIEATARGKGAGEVVGAGAEGAALGAVLGLAGAVPGASEFYLSPKMRDGIMKSIMPRLLGTGAEAAVGGGYAAAKGGDTVDVASNAALFGLLGFISNANYSARARDAAKDSVIEPVVRAFVDSGVPKEQAVASARQALEQGLAQAGQASVALRRHPNFPVFLDEIAGKIRQAHPEVSPQQASILAEAEAAKLFINGEVSIESLGKMKMKVEPGEALPPAKAAEQTWEDAAAAPAAPEGPADPVAQEMEAMVAAAQERGGGGSLESIKAAMELPPDLAEGLPQSATDVAPKEDIQGVAPEEVGLVAPEAELASMEAIPESSVSPVVASEGQVAPEAPVAPTEPLSLAQRFPDAPPKVIESLERSVGAASREGMEAAKFKPTEVEGSAVRGARGGAPSDEARLLLPPLRVRPSALLPEEVAATVQAAGIKVGAKMSLLQGVKDPAFGRIPKGESVTVRGVDLEGGNVIIEFGGKEVQKFAIVPVEAVAKAVRNAPPAPFGPAAIKDRVLAETGVKKEKTVHLTEQEALGAKFQAESKGAREATLVAQKEMRTRLREQSRVARAAMAKAQKELRHEIKEAVINGKWEQATRNKIVEFARAFLPPEARGALLGKVANAKGPKDLLRAFWDIDQKSTLISNKKMMKDIRILVDRVMSSPTFPVGMKSRIREMLEDVRLENWSPRTLNDLRMQQELIDELRADGVDVTIPQSVFDKISKISKRPLADMDGAELEDILSDLRFMIEQGKDIRAAIRNLDELERLDHLADLVAGTKKIEKPTTKEGVKRPFLSPALTWAEQRKNDWLRMADFGQSVGIATLPIQVVVDDLDGSYLGGGANRRVIWNPLQDGYVTHQATISEANDFVAKVVKEHGALDVKQQDRVTTVLMREQLGGREKLHQLGMDDEAINAVKLTPAEQGTLDALRGYLNDPKRVRALARVTAMLYNQEFVAVEKYWPMKTDFNAPKEGASAQDAILEQIDLRRKNVEKGMLIERVENAKQKIRSDIYGVFLEAAQQGSMIENMAGPILKAHALIRDPKYLEVAGDAGQTFWRDFLDVLARDGKISAARRNWTIDFLRKNMGVGALTFKIPTAIIQLSSLGSGAALTGGAHMRAALMAGPEWDGFVDKNMPLIRERKGGDPAVKEVMEGGLMTKFKEAGFKWIVQMDHFAARQVALAAYFQWADLHGVVLDPEKPVPAGLRYAQSVPGKSMASPWLIDMPLSLSRGNILGNASLDRALLQFQSETLAKFSLVTRQVFGRARSGDKKGAAESFAWLGASLLYEAGVRRAWRWSIYGLLLGIGAISKQQYDKATEKEDSYFKQVGMAALGTIPFVGSVGNYLAYDSGPIPAVDVAGDVLKGGANTLLGAAQGKPYKSMRGLVQSLTAIAMLSGVPGSGQVGWLIKQPLRNKQDKRTKKKKRGSF